MACLNSNTSASATCIWKTNPVLANIDGLDEVCDDYTDAATVIENLQTIYEVGKGYAEQALDALESLADDDTSIDDELGSEIVARSIPALNMRACQARRDPR